MNAAMNRARCCILVPESLSCGAEAVESENHGIPLRLMWIIHEVLLEAYESFNLRAVYLL